MGKRKAMKKMRNPHVKQFPTFFSLCSNGSEWESYNFLHSQKSDTKKTIVNKAKKITVNKLLPSKEMPQIIPTRN